MAACSQMFPGATTRYCVRHVYANFRNLYSAEKLKEKSWKAAKATNLIGFNIVMDVTEDDDEQAYK